MIIQFPSQFFFWTRVENHKEIKEQYFDRLKEHCENYRDKNDSWECDVSSSFFAKEDPAKHTVFDDHFYQSVVWSTFNECLDEVTGSGVLPHPENATIDDVWANLYRPGDFQEVHDHMGSVWSGIYVMHLQELNTTMFQYHNTVQPYFNDIGTASIDTKHITEGNVIWFPSSLNHYVNPAKKERLTVAFNLQCEYDREKYK